MTFGVRFDEILKRVNNDRDIVDCCYYIHDMNKVCYKKFKCCVRIEMTMKRCPHFNNRKEFK